MEQFSIASYQNLLHKVVTLQALVMAEIQYMVILLR